ncbi:MAG: hypothetical protein FD170_2513 [Bacteroidetes bacterium]|nr:MAG: hypothetical protein FD170_2513 [Bacteroidota bacterium]
MNQPKYSFAVKKNHRLFVRKIFLLFTLPLVTFFIFSCQKTRDDLLPKGRSQMYFQSILCPDSSIRVFVGRTAGIQDDNSPVNDAIVLAFVNNVFADTLQFVENGIYELWRQPEIYDTVRIEVISNGKMSGETIIPSPAYVNNSSYVCSTHYYALDQEYHGTLTFSIEDDPETENYYEMLIYTREELSGGSYRIYSKVSDYYIFKPDIIIQNEGDWDFKPTTLFFSDKMFDGKTGYFSFIMSVSDEYGYITLRSISKEYYYYRKYYTRHAFNAQLNSDGIRNLLFTGEPLDMYTNIQGGLGVCAAYSSTVTKIESKP